MRKIVVIKKMPIQFILFSILFHNLNQFCIIYKILLQALASRECVCVFPSERAQVRAAALLVFTPHLPAILDSSLYFSLHTPRSWNTFSSISFGEQSAG